MSNRTISCSKRSAACRARRISSSVRQALVRAIHSSRFSCNSPASSLLPCSSEPISTKPAFKKRRRGQAVGNSLYIGPDHRAVVEGVDLRTVQANDSQWPGIGPCIKSTASREGMAPAQRCNARAMRSCKSGRLAAAIRPPASPPAQRERRG
ncbi:MAG: hypothetical protein MZV64_01775 [Ignavibacteriales bacterium]|nr:hypothetical protein [Ignavibacteriales bacterium]